MDYVLIIVVEKEHWRHTARLWKSHLWFDMTEYISFTREDDLV